jgi:16S rRNA processing protein RimM
MNKADCFNLGYVAKLHGFKGEVSLFFDVSEPLEYEQINALFIAIGEHLTPFFIERISYKGKGFFQVKFENVNSEIDAKRILRQELYLPLNMLPELGDKNFYDHEIIGYNVVDEDFGSCGVVSQVIDYKINPLLQLQFKEKEVLIPLIEGLVKKVDRKNKTLFIKSPSGLIEMYVDDN